MGLSEASRTGNQEALGRGQRSGKLSPACPFGRNNLPRCRPGAFLPSGRLQHLKLAGFTASFNYGKTESLGGKYFIHKKYLSIPRRP